MSVFDNDIRQYVRRREIVLDYHSKAVEYSTETTFGPFENLGKALDFMCSQNDRHDNRVSYHSGYVEFANEYIEIIYFKQTPYVKKLKDFNLELDTDT